MMMTAAPPSPEKIDPVIYLDHTLETTWCAICERFDVVAEIPELQFLFCKAEISNPYQAAERVLVNMITESIEHVGRFSPWYTQPARKFGIVSVRDQETNCRQWILSHEALEMWKSELGQLRSAIEKNTGLIQASLLLDQLSIQELSDGSQITARCECCPPKIIRIKRTILEESTITCETCNCAFAPA